MGISRREFLKVAGLSAIAGVGGSLVLSIPGKRDAEAYEFLRHPKALTAKKWGMVVDLRKFKTEEDYKKVIEACHNIHNVPQFDNPKHEIKWIWTDTFKHAFPGQEHKYIMEKLEHKPFLLLCNHCENPPCVRVCPTKATFKSKEGIIMQDPHRCIGCRFCMAGCPYGARSFNWKDPKPFIKKINRGYPVRTIGVVEKCTFCEERLARGLIPACVEASEGGLIFGDLGEPNSEVRVALRANYTIRRKSELGTEPSVFYIIEI